jgi:hypothetical protein
VTETTKADRIRAALADPAAPWYGSDLVPLVADYLDEAEQRLLWANEAEKVLRGYEAWEGAMVLDQTAWRGGMAPLPTLTYPLWDTLLELQAERNKLLNAQENAPR